MVIYLIKHPHGVTPRDFGGDSDAAVCLGHHLNICRINFSPDGCTRWTGIFKYPHFGLLEHDKLKFSLEQLTLVVPIENW